MVGRPIKNSLLDQSYVCYWYILSQKSVLNDTFEKALNLIGYRFLKKFRNVCGICVYTMLHDIKDETFFKPPKSQGWCKNEYCHSLFMIILENYLISLMVEQKCLILSIICVVFEVSSFLSWLVPSSRSGRLETTNGGCRILCVCLFSRFHQPRASFLETEKYRKTERFVKGKLFCYLPFLRFRDDKAI